uniref:Uncharacterized protein n=1 Tax=Ciona savignyi TaxID=51511 RepID=H2ZJC7_CIOSA
MTSKSQENLEVLDSAQGNENAGERRRFSPFRAIRKIFREGRKGVKRMNKSRGNLTQDASDDEAEPRRVRLKTSTTSTIGLNRPMSMSHESVFSPEINIEKSEIFRSPPKDISDRSLSEESLTAASSAPSKVSQLQDQLRLRLQPVGPSGLEVPPRLRQTRPLSGPPSIFINGLDQPEVSSTKETDETMGNNGSKKE